MSFHQAVKRETLSVSLSHLNSHKEGSKAFRRYRKIDDDTNRQTVSLLEWESGKHELDVNITQSGMCKFYTYHFCCLLESLAKAFKIEWDLGSYAISLNP